MSKSRLIPAFACVLLCLPLIACKPGANAGAHTEPTAAAVKIDPLFADPKVGDLYAAELTHFSGADFEQTDKDEQTFGLMKAIKVEPDTITAITENASWPKKQGAINDLRGDLAGIEWDDSEKIVIKRAEIPQLVADGKLIEARRLTP